MYSGCAYHCAAVAWLLAFDYERRLSRVVYDERAEPGRGTNERLQQGNTTEWNGMERNGTE